MRQYRKGTILIYIGDESQYGYSRHFKKGNTYVLGNAKPHGYYSFDEISSWISHPPSFVESSKNFKIGEVPKWKKFINTGKTV